MSGLEIGLIVACAFLCVLLAGAIRFTTALNKLFCAVAEQRDDYMRIAAAQRKTMADQRSIIQKQQERLRERT